ncbi:putative integral membrane protein [Ilyonectria robusta]
MQSGDLFDASHDTLDWPSLDGVSKREDFVVQVIHGQNSLLSFLAGPPHLGGRHSFFTVAQIVYILTTGISKLGVALVLLRLADKYGMRSV